MNTLRKILVIACTIALAAFGAAACGSEKGEGGGGGGGGGEINIALTSFPDYVDPQLSYTVEGWEVLWNVYTPLLTYKHAKGKEGTQVVPALAEDMPEISPDGKTYKLKLRPNMKYSDGTPIKASDFAYAIQRLFKADSGGSVFYDVIVGATDYAEGKAETISGIKTDDNTGDITIDADRAERHLRERARADVRRTRTAEHPAGQGRDEQAPARQRSVHDQPGQRAAHPDDGAQSELPDRQGRRRQRGGRRQRRQDRRQREQEQQRPGHRRRAEQGRLHARPAGRGPARRGQGEVPRSLPDGGVDQHLLLLHEHGEGPRSTTSRFARPSTTRSIPKRSTGSSAAACTRRSRSCRRACLATRSTSSTRAPT